MLLKYAITAENVKTGEFEMIFADADMQACRERLMEITKRPDLDGESETGFVYKGYKYRITRIRKATQIRKTGYF